MLSCRTSSHATGHDWAVRPEIHEESVHKCFGSDGHSRHSSHSAVHEAGRLFPELCPVMFCGSYLHRDDHLLRRLQQDRTTIRIEQITYNQK